MRVTLQLARHFEMHFSWTRRTSNWSLRCGALPHEDHLNIALILAKLDHFYFFILLWQSLSQIEFSEALFFLPLLLGRFGDWQEWAQKEPPWLLLTQFWHFLFIAILTKDWLDLSDLDECVWFQSCEMLFWLQTFSVPKIFFLAALVWQKKSLKLFMSKKRWPHFGSLLWRPWMSQLAKNLMSRSSINSLPGIKFSFAKLSRLVRNNPICEKSPGLPFFLPGSVVESLCN